MVRRVQANLNGDDYYQTQHQSQNNYYTDDMTQQTSNNPNNSGGFVQQNAYVDHSQTQDYSNSAYQTQSQYQNDYDYSSNYNYSGYQNAGTAAADQNYTSQSSSSYTYDNSAGGNTYNNYGGYSNDNSSGYGGNYANPAKSNFPVIQPSPIQQTTSTPQTNAQYNYGSNQVQEQSWISAFGSGGFANEPPLLEELGINFAHIKDKTIASINPFRKLDSGTLADADLTGPLLFCFLFGVSLLFSGKVHFGYIYGVATLGWVSIFAILNLMTQNGVSFYLTASVLGYCLLPMVLLSALAILLKLRGFIGMILGITSVSWCTLSSSTIFVASFGMRDQQILIAYPIFLLYSCFALMTIF